MTPREAMCDLHFAIPTGPQTTSPRFRRRPPIRSTRFQDFKLTHYRHGLRLDRGVVSGDEKRALEVASRLEAGTIYINNYYRRGAPGLPSGGVKASGYGRDNAATTLHEFVQAKAIRVPTGRGKIPVW